MAHRLVITTCPDTAAAEALAEPLLRQGLAACVSILPGARSLYEWKGELVREQECVLLIKSREACYPELEAAIREQHPYELPEVIAVPISDGLAPYLAWIDSQTGKE